MKIDQEILTSAMLKIVDFDNNPDRQAGASDETTVSLANNVLVRSMMEMVSEMSANTHNERVSNAGTCFQGGFEAGVLYAQLLATTENQKSRTQAL